jgi:hypothetical protein
LSPLTAGTSSTSTWRTDTSSTPTTWSSYPNNYEYLLVGPDGLRLSKVPLKDLELIRRYGDWDDEFAPHAELYRHLPSAETTGR